MYYSVSSHINMQNLSQMPIRKQFAYWYKSLLSSQDFYLIWQWTDIVLSFT